MQEALEADGTTESPRQPSDVDAEGSDPVEDKEHPTLSVETSLPVDREDGEEKSDVEHDIPILKWSDTLRSPVGVPIFSPSLDLGNSAALHGTGTSKRELQNDKLISRISSVLI